LQKTHLKSELGMKYYHCPNCGVTIPDKEDKILKHKTFCKSSYENFSAGSVFSESTIESLSDLLAVNINKVPQGVTIQKNQEGETKITYKSTRNLPWQLLAASFIPAAYLFLPRIPFHYIIPLFVGSGIMILLFLLNLISAKMGKWELTLKNGKGTFFCGIGKFGRTQKFDYTKDSSVSIFMLNQPTPGLLFAAMVIGNSPLFLPVIPWLISKTGIAVTTNDKRFIFGGTLPQLDVMKYMAACTLREITK
jgi:hypothetical protein